MRTPFTIFFRFYSSFRVRLDRVFTKIRSQYWRDQINTKWGHAGKGIEIRQHARLHPSQACQIKIGENVTIAQRANVFIGNRATLELGKNVFIGIGSVLIANECIEIGEGTQIAHGVSIIDSDHSFQSKKTNLVDQGMKTQPIIIGKNVWIGAGAIVLKGRRIGDHAVVGAGCVLTEDLSPGQIAVGNPARILNRNIHGKD